MQNARIPALDGLRGVLALAVVLFHVLADPSLGLVDPLRPSLAVFAIRLCVWTFFVLSGLVLVRSYDGRLGLFMVRRAARLWPLFALTMLAGYALHGQVPQASRLLWLPPFGGARGAITLRLPDGPAWSLFIEAWAMPFMPLIVWASARTDRALAVSAGILVVAYLTVANVSALALFIFGGWLGNFRWESRILESSPAQWLGQVSYSLYLTHWLVLVVALRVSGSGIGGVAALPLMFVVAHIAWKFVERPSIRLSRRVGDLWFSGARKDTMPA